MEYTREEKELADLCLRKLEIRFENKIEYGSYYLSYSGGRDSFLLYWFIKNYLKTNEIKIVSVNTRIEHVSIRKRMYRDADIVLLPSIMPHDVIKTYGMPCFTKIQDEYIKRYQAGSRSANTMKRVLGTEKSKHNLNKKAKELTITGRLHKVSQDCCFYTKKETLHQFEKISKLKPIIGVRQNEGALRSSAYQTCLSEKGKFSPLFDFPDAAVDAIYNVYHLEIPEVYEYARRTGCIGCPYINDVYRIEQDLALATPAQRKYIINLFKESYDIKGVNYQQFMKEAEPIGFVIYKQLDLCFK